MEKSLIFVVLALLLITAVSASTPTKFRTWKSSTFDSYNRKIFPRQNQNDNVTVDIKYHLIAITGFDEVAGQMDTVGYLKVKWNNELLTWTSTDFPSVLMPQGNFWFPSLVVSNSVQSLKELGHRSYPIRVEKDGDCEWTVGIVAKTSCSVDVSYYPFDTQLCKVTLNPWGFNDNQIYLLSTESEIDLTHYMENVQWSITETSILSKSVSSTSFLHFNIHMKRRPGYFVVNMVIPILILGLLNGLVFLLPADSGERVGFAITAFLTFAIFLTMVSSNLPKASEPMSLLCYFLTLMLVMSALSCVITIMTLRVYHQDEDSKVPNWLRHVVSFLNLTKFKKWFCKSKPNKNAVHANEDDDYYDDEDMSPIKRKMALEDRHSSNSSSEEKESKDDNTSDIANINWRKVGKTLDMFFFFLFVVGTVIIAVFFLVPLATESTDSSN